MVKLGVLRSIVVPIRNAIGRSIKAVNGIGVEKSDKKDVDEITIVRPPKVKDTLCVPTIPTMCFEIYEDGYAKAL